MDKYVKLSCGCWECSRCKGTGICLSGDIDEYKSCPECHNTGTEKKCKGCAKALGWLDDSKRGY